MATDTIIRWLSGIASRKDSEAIRQAVQPIADRMSAQAIINSTLVIKAGSSPVAKTGAASSYFVVNGKLVLIAASTDMPAIPATPVLTAGSLNVVCFFVDQGGTTSAAWGTESTTLAGVVFPQFPKNKALVGVIIITASGAFTGGTTALDNTTLTVYVSPVGAFDPTVLTG